MNKDDLYSALVRMCQQYGITNESTYDALHRAVESIDTDTEEN